MELDQYILETLSFYDFMTKEQLILDLDPVKLLEFSNFTLDDLEKKLVALAKKGKIEINRDEADVRYRRLFPKKSLVSRAISLFKGLFKRA